MVTSLFLQSLEQTILHSSNYYAMERVTGKENLYYLYALIYKIIPLKYVPEEFKNTEEICYIGVKYGRDDVLKYVPEKLRTEEICLLSFTKLRSNLFYFPQNFITENVCLEYINNCTGCRGECLTRVKKTYNVCLAAVKHRGISLKYVPEELKTADLCLTAVTDNGFALKYVPEELKTLDLCLLNVNIFRDAFKFIPIKYLTVELSLQLSKRNYPNFIHLEQHVPHFLTHELFLQYFETHPRAYKYLPNYLKTDKVCLKLARCGMLEYIPEDKKTDKLCITSYNTNIKSFEFLPQHLKTYKRSLKYLSLKPYFIRYVPQNIIDKKMALIAIKFDSSMCLGHIPHNVFDEELIYFIINNNKQIKHIPIDKITNKMCYDIIDCRGLKYLPNEVKTDELCLYALNKDASLENLSYSPSHLTKKYWLNYIQNNTHFYYDIPNELLTEDMCFEYLYFHKFKVWNCIPKKFVENIVARVLKEIECKIQM